MVQGEARGSEVISLGSIFGTGAELILTHRDALKVGDVAGLLNVYSRLIYQLVIVGKSDVHGWKEGGVRPAPT